MRFRRKTAAERRQEKALNIQIWHKKFAWLPVRLTSDNNEIRWLEFVLRKGTIGYRPSRLDGSRVAYGCEWKYADSSLDVLRMKDTE